MSLVSFHLNTIPNVQNLNMETIQITLVYLLHKDYFNNKTILQNKHVSIKQKGAIDPAEIPVQLFKLKKNKIQK
jgi:hypothetical protein